MTEASFRAETDKRSERRRRTMRLARITLDDGQTVPCVIRDWSTTSAKLSVARRYPLPSGFLLKVNDEDAIVAVRLIWRRGDSAGISIAGLANRP